MGKFFIILGLVAILFLSSTAYADDSQTGDLQSTPATPSARLSQSYLFLKYCSYLEVVDSFAGNGQLSNLPPKLFDAILAALDSAKDNNNGSDEILKAFTSKLVVMTRLHLGN